MTQPQDNYEGCYMLSCIAGQDCAWPGAAWCPFERQELERRPFDQAEFDEFRKDPKRQALVNRILDTIEDPEDEDPQPEEDLRDDF